MKNFDRLKAELNGRPELVIGDNRQIVSFSQATIKRHLIAPIITDTAQAQHSTR
jgi:hypothetical protein